jgi:hypothetical protein
LHTPTIIGGYIPVANKIGILSPDFKAKIDPVFLKDLKSKCPTPNEVKKGN